MRIQARWPVVVVLFVGVLLSCARGGRVIEVAAGAGGPPELGSSLNVRPEGDSVHFELHITNTTSGTVNVTFDSAQRYDFMVTRANGEMVWQWSEGMMFAQAQTRETLAAGASRRYSATWLAQGHTGDYVATARLTSRDYPVELRTVFRLPAD